MLCLQLFHLVILFFSSFLAKCLSLLPNTQSANPPLTRRLPSCSEVFALVDRLCLLSSGRLVYFGDPSDALAVFEDAGAPCPEHMNVADFFLHATNTDFARVCFGTSAIIRFVYPFRSDLQN